jgi:hypothetical protein
MNFQKIGFYTLSTLGFIFSAGNVAKSIYEVFIIHDFNTTFDIISFVLTWGNTFICEHFFTNELSKFVYINAFVTIPLWYMILDTSIIYQLFGTLFGMCSVTPLNIGLNLTNITKNISFNISLSDFLFVELNMILTTLCFVFNQNKMFIIIANWIIAVITPVVWGFVKSNRNIENKYSKIFFVISFYHAAINDFLARLPVFDKLLDNQTSLFDFTHSTFTIVMGTDSYILIASFCLLVFVLSQKTKLQRSIWFYIFISIFISTPLSFGFFVLDIWNFNKKF